MIAGSVGGRLAECAVMTVGGVLESCSSTLWWLFASRRATAVLWMLWRHILQGESSCFILYTSILSQWLTVWCVFLDILDYPEGKNMCVHACLCAPDHSVAPTAFPSFLPLLLLPRHQCFFYKKVLETLLGLSDWISVFHKWYSIH